MYTGLSRTNVATVVLGLALLLLSVTALANLDGVTLNSPPDSGNVSGNYLLNATANGWATSVSFYWSNDSGTTWNLIQDVPNTTVDQSEFTYSWDSSGIQDGTGLYFNATAVNGTDSVSEANTGITLDNTAPVITINQPQEYSGLTSPVTLNVTLTETNPSVSWWELDSNGTNITGCVGCTDFENTTSMGDGVHNITIWSNDTLGNEDSQTVVFLVGTTPVKVNIKDSESGTNLENAQINFTNASFTFTNTTGSDGNATIFVDAGRLYDITVIRDSYSSNTSLAGQNFSSTGELTITLDGNSTVQGYVSEIGSGNPLVATVSVHDNSTGNTLYSVQSASNGYYAINVPGDLSYYVNITSTGYAPFLSQNYTGSATINASLYQEGYGSFTFIVTDRWNSRPVPGANITVEWSVSESALTNSSGIVMIEVPEGGSFDIYARAAGYMDNTSLTGLTIAEGTNTDVYVTMLGDSKIYGYTRDSANQQGMSGAFLELWDESNNHKLNWSSSYFYNATSAGTGYYEIYYPSTLSGLSLYVHCGLSGYSDIEVYSGGTQMTDISLVGTAIVKGKVVDKGNTSVEIKDATVQLLNATSGASLYQQLTFISGNFSINVRNGTNYTLHVSKTGYTAYTDATPYQTSHDYGNVELEGTALVFGKVVDYQNQSINLEDVSVTLSYQNLTYTTTTDSLGNFALNVSPGYTYTITYTKMGYTTKTASSYVSGYKNLGTITLYGSSLVNGTVTDPTRYHSSDRELEDVQVKLEGGSRVFTTTTNYNGFYSLYIPSDILTYTITFTKDGFKQKTVSQSGNVTLTGATRVEGRVYDLYNGQNLEDAEVCFDDYDDGYYCIDTNSSGYYSIDLGVESNYFIEAYKFGYYWEYFGFTDTLGFPYDSGDTGAWDRTEDIGLRGNAPIYIKTIDKFSGDPVENSQICMKREGEENCFYSQITNNNGETIFYAKSYDYYDMVINSLGYPSEDVFDSYYISSGGYSTTVQLDAYAKIHVYDQYATEAMRNIPNANATLYYFNNQTSFNYTLNETNVTITTSCGFLQRDGINVILNGETKTTSGSSSVTFYRVPKGLHIVEINGTAAGCGLDTQTVDVSETGISYVFPEYTAYNLDPTNLYVLLENAAGTGLPGATVTANSTTGGQNYTATDLGSGYYNVSYITADDYTIYASLTSYDSNSTNQTVYAGYDSNFTVLMKSQPGNLSIYVSNGTLALDGINVTLSNGTDYAATTSGGWANFTDMVGLYDIEVNGTGTGYEYNLTENYFVAPSQSSQLTYTLDSTSVTITVMNQSYEIVEGSNVTLYSGASIAQSATGNPLTALTNSSGMVSFSRVSGGIYTLNITKTNYTDVNSTLGLGFELSTSWQHTYYHNKTMLEVLVMDEDGEPLYFVGAVLANYTYGYEEYDYTYDSNVVFDLGGSPGGLYSLDIYGYQGDGLYSFKTDLTITQNVLNTETISLDDDWLNVTVIDSLGDPVEDGVVVSVYNTNTTVSGSAIFHHLLEDLSVWIYVDGSLKGYGLNDTGSTTILNGSNSFTSVIPITSLTVHVTNSSGSSVENATVSFLNGTTYGTEDNGKGVLLNGTTDSSGNVTFSFVPVGKYKINVEKDTLENYTFYELNVSQAGFNNSVTLYISYQSTESLDSGNPADTALTFYVNNATGSSIQNATVKVLNRTDNSTVAGGLTNSSGQVTLYVPPDNIYNFMVDGEKIGYAKVYNYSVPIGYAGVSEGYTDSSGWVFRDIHGRVNYMIKVENAYGYYGYDDNETGTVRNGTYDDAISNAYVRPSIQVPMTGRTNLTGVVHDANFVNPVDLEYEPVYSTVYLYASSGCTGQVRYTNSTAGNGSYSLYVSPKQLGQDVDMLYCLKVVGTGWNDGFEYNLIFQPGAEEQNRSVQGSGRVSGAVKEVVTGKSLASVNVSLRSKKCYGGYSNCEAYRQVTEQGGVFSFNVSSHSDYYPYDIILNKTNYFSVERNDTIYTDNSSLVYYMIPLGRSIMNLNITGSNLTENVTIKWGDELYSSLHEYCNLSQNLLSCLLPSGGRVLTVNGSDIGYGVYSQYMYLVQGQNYTQNIQLNETTVNVTISNQEDSPLDNITVALNGFQNTTQDGYVYFRKVPGGMHNVTFSGYLSTIYGIGSQTVQVNVVPGQNNTYHYTFNETQFLVVVRNETSSSVSGLSVYMSNENNSFQNSTDSNGQVLFRQVPYGNYTISFNATQVLSLGYQDMNETADVLLGEGALSGNNKTILLNDTEVYFNITNSTGPLENINVSMLQSGLIAQNGYGSYLTELTNSSGFVVFHNVIAGSYVYVADGSSQGYETVQQMLTVTTYGADVSITLNNASGTTTTTTTTFTTTTTLGGGGGGGGGGGTVPSLKINVTGDQAEITGLTVSSGSSKYIEIDWTIYKLLIYASQYISNGKISMLKMEPWDVWEVPAVDEGLVYNYFKIDTEGIEGKTNSVELYFSVDSGWIEENSIGNISLWRYDSGWKAVDTQEIGSTPDKKNYKSVFKGFSYFAIVGSIREQAPGTTPSRPQRPGEETVCGNGICEPGEDCPGDCMETTPELSFDLGIILPSAISILVILIVLFYFKEKRDEETKLAEIKLPPPPEPFVKIKEIIEEPQKYVGKRVLIEGEIIGSEFLAEENRVQYRIKDSTGEISGLSRHAGFKGQGTVEGIVKTKRKKVYVDF